MLWPTLRRCHTLLVALFSWRLPVPGPSIYRIAARLSASVCPHCLTFSCHRRRSRPGASSQRLIFFLAVYQPLLTGACGAWTIKITNSLKIGLSGVSLAYS